MANLHAATWPVIDYRAHPAFSHGARGPQPSADFEQEVEGLVLQANDALRLRYEATERLPDEGIIHWCDTALGAPLEQLRGVCAAALPSSAIMSACVDAALHGTYRDARAEALFRNRVAGTDADVGRPESAEVLAALRKNSISVGNIDARQIAAMVADLRPQMQILQTSESARRGVRAWRTLPRAGRYWSVLNDALEALGYVEATDAFYGCEMELLSSSLVYSHDKEVWWRDCYGDLDVSTSPAAYFHHDQDWHQIKAVLYLTPASRENGAFSYVEGGQHFRSGNVLAHFYFHLVNEMGRAARRSGTGSESYYRRGFTDPALRAGFVALPRALQGATHFGDDLHEADPQTAALIARERVVESSTGNVVLFNGSDLFHRGGLVTRGERWSLQLMFGPRVSRGERWRTRVQHAALVAASKAIGWRSVDRVRALRRGVP